MRNFFKDLVVCEKELDRFTNETNLSDVEMLTRDTFLRLVDFVQSGVFTHSKASKFISQNFRLSLNDLVVLWKTEFGKEKSVNTIRGQVSTTSQELYKLFGVQFSEELINCEPKRVADILNSFEVSCLTFKDIFSDELNTQVAEMYCTEDFSIEDLAAEISVLSKFKKENIKGYLSNLSSSKLAYIKKALDKPIVVDHEVNANKVALLSIFNQNSLLNPTEPCSVQLSQEHLELIKALPKGSSLVDELNVTKLKDVFYTFFTQEGLKRFLTGYTQYEVAQAIKEIKEGK